jgi:hypothetical protein
VVARSVRRPKVCICGECKEPVYARGLSRGCYRSLGRKVQLGDWTWEQLIDAGQALPIVPYDERRRRPARRRAQKALAAKAS